MLRHMTMPGFQDMMLPVLEFTADGLEHKLRELIEETADRFDLGEAERSQLLPSGQQTVVQNRVAWARTYLVKAGLLDSTRRGYVRITDKGRQLLANAPGHIDVAYLRANYPAIKEFISGSGSSNDVIKPPSPPDDDRTPEERLEQSYLHLRNELVEELLTQVKDLAPVAFERLVVELLVKMGYGGSLKDAGRAVGQSGDGGIDGIIKEDRLGLDTIYLQAKRYTEQAIGRPAIQGFVGALQGVRARKGIFITTSRFAAPAIEYAKSIDTKVVLIDGQQLAEYMIDFDLGVTRVSTFQVKRIDADYFEQA
jgi:restriction system protein